MVTVQTVLYLCAKFHNFPTIMSMGCHRLPEQKEEDYIKDRIGATLKITIGA